MLEELRQRIEKEMESKRATLDQLKVKAALVKLELRDKQDAVVADLERAYDRAKQALVDVQGATEGQAAELKKAAVEKWESFKAKLRDALQ